MNLTAAIAVLSVLLAFVVAVALILGLKLTQKHNSCKSHTPTEETQDRQSTKMQVEGNDSATLNILKTSKEESDAQDTVNDRSRHKSHMVQQLK